MWFGSVSLVLLLVTLSLCIVPSNTMTYGERVKLREDARNMFYHAYSNYMESAYPADELKPLSCTGRGSEGRGSLDDVLGGFSLTLIDALDTLVVLEDFEEFERASRLVIKHVTFNRNTVVSVFETTIRVLGGLLSAHLMSVEHSAKLKKGYNGELLLMATELGDRMLPAFNTPTGIPYSRVNLMMGIPRGEPAETCTAGAGTLILEFGLLSKLTGNPAYMNAARRAIIEIWNRRSQINLVGNVINVATGQWIRGDSSIGAGIDSFFEYLLKGYVLFGDLELYNILVQAYNSMEKYGKKGSWYVSVHMVNGNVVREWVESLQMFWPGLQVSLGQVAAAAENFNTYYQLWRRYGLPPEAYSIHAKTPVPGVSGYPLRPEMIESAYMLFSATQDHSYLHAGKFFMQNIINYTRVDCGFAAVSDVLTKKLEDRFDSYFLSETCKYLYLLFDPDNAPYYKDIVFTTEGHLIPLRYEYHDQAREAVNGKYASHNSLTCKNPQIHKNTPLFPPPSAAKAKPTSKKSTPSSSPPPPPPRPSPKAPPKAPKAPSFEQLAQQFSTEDVLDEPPRTVVEAKLDGEDQVFMVVSANFGPPIESEFRAKLVYGIPADGCVPLTYPVSPSSPTIVMIDRGTCMFGEKVRIASKAGVDMVMIVDNINQPNVFLMTDGLLESHGPVSVPSFLVNRTMGDRIKASLLSSEEDYYITVRPAEEDEFFAEEAQFYAQTQQLAINLPAGGLMNQDALAEAVLQQLQQMQIKVDGSFSIQYMDANNQPAMLTINGDSVKIENQNLFIPPAIEEKTAESIESTSYLESESESTQESKYSPESSKNSKLHETGHPNP